MPSFILAASAWATVVTPTLSLLGLLLCAWLALRSAGARGLPGCGAGSGCDAVTRSRWAKWLGMPVATPAAAVYGLVLASSLVAATSPRGPAGDAARAVLLAAALLLAAAAVWFVSLQVLLLRRLCPYCLLLHCFGLVVAAAAVLDQPGGGRAYAALPPSDRLLVLCSAGAAVAALILGQVLVKPRTYLVKQVAAPPPVTPGPSGPDRMARRRRLAAPRSAEADGAGGAGGAVAEGGSGPEGPGVTGRRAAPAPARPREPAGQVSSGPNPYLGRRVVAAGVPLQAGTWPVVGRPGAAEVVVLLFCYTCGNCRHLFDLLEEVMGREPERLDVMLVPVPTERGCNPHIRNCGPEHADACAYARLALWVWAAGWAKFERFNRFLFQGLRPPPLEAARARAAALLGRPLGDPRRPEPSADRLIALGVGLHKSIGAGLTPTLLLPRGYAAGRVPTAQKLEEILDQHGCAGRAAVAAAPDAGAEPAFGFGPR